MNQRNKANTVQTNKETNQQIQNGKVKQDKQTTG